MPDARRQKPDAQSPVPGALLSRWLPVLAYMAFIFGLSSLTATPAMPGGSDKLLHALLYAGFGLLLGRALAGGWHGVTWTTVLTVTVCGALYGISDEVHQYFNPPRAVEMADVVADTIGSAAGAAALRAWGIIRGRDGL
ncbi:MAG: VanZ family protein [Vicinamibacterales bacterium]